MYNQTTVCQYRSQRNIRKNKDTPTIILGKVRTKSLNTEEGKSER